jgi:indole-3-glycerol phosphate synthase
MTSDLLSAVTAAARRSAELRSRGDAGRVVEREALARSPQPGRFAAALAGAGPSVIAECKRRSPSRGVLRRDYDPAAIAMAYERAGAAAISVLTEPTFFDGHLDHLRAVRACAGVPILRKDFIVTPFQIVEARAAGADAVLLIAAALEPSELSSLLRVSGESGLDALVEVHDEAELAAALDAGAQVVGVNSRNLRTLDVDMETLDRLGPRIPPDVTAVAESGIRTAADVGRLHALRYSAFLVGERLVTAPDPGEALRGLLHDVAREAR